MRTLFFSIFSILLLACTKENATPEPDNGKYESGVMVINEGPFGSGTGTLDFYNRVTNTYETNIFEKVNNRPLGNIVQSYSKNANMGFVVVNNAN